MIRANGPGRVAKGAPSPTQMNPDLLPAGDQWVRVCPHCNPAAKIQGGLQGLTNHIMTVHPGQVIPDA